MKPNLWIYANEEEQSKTAWSLKVFGAEIFKRAKTINEIEILKKIKNGLNNKSLSSQDPKIIEFAQEYLIDCIRSLIFFENYMKAELIIRGFCVHCINIDYTGFKDLAKKQYTRPIELKEINDIENFFVDTKNKIIHHNAVKEKTIGIKELISSKEYLSNYDLDDSMIGIIEKLNRYRNRLHFYESIEFQITEDYISELIKINHFVDMIFKKGK